MHMPRFDSRRRPGHCRVKTLVKFLTPVSMCNVVLYNNYIGLHAACLGWLSLGAALHSSDEPGELSQWLCHDDSTITIVWVLLLLLLLYASEPKESNPGQKATTMLTHTLILIHFYLENTLQYPNVTFFINWIHYKSHWCHQVLNL